MSGDVCVPEKGGGPVRQNLAVLTCSKPEGRSFQKKFGIECSERPTQTKDARTLSLANMGAQTFFFECLQEIANAEHFAIKNLRKPDRAVAKENRGLSGRKEMFYIFVSCGSKGSLEKQRGGKLVLNVRIVR